MPKISKDNDLIIELQKKYPEYTLEELTLICNSQFEYVYYNIKENRGENVYVNGIGTFTKKSQHLLDIIAGHIKIKKQ